MVSIVPYNWLPSTIMPQFKLDRKPDDVPSKDIVDVPFPGMNADVCLI
jgi:hypothetical protein